MDDPDVFADYSAPLADVDVERLLDRADAVMAMDTVPEQEILRLWWGTASARRLVQSAVRPLYALLDDWYEGAAPEVELRVEMMARTRQARTLLSKEQP